MPCLVSVSNKHGEKAGICWAELKGRVSDDRVGESSGVISWNWPPVQTVPSFTKLAAVLSGSKFPPLPKAPTRRKQILHSENGKPAEERKRSRAISWSGRMSRIGKNKTAWPCFAWACTSFQIACGHGIVNAARARRHGREETPAVGSPAAQARQIPSKRRTSSRFESDWAGVKVRQRVGVLSK